MSAMIQIRNVPDSLHRTLKARAALAGTSLSDYLRLELERIARMPTRDDLYARIAALDAVEPIDTAALIRAERDRR
jgi:plasmid stability protein